MAQVVVDKQNVLDKALDKDAAKPEAELLALPEPKEAAATARVSRVQIEAEAAQMAPEAVEAIHTALRMLSAMCDGAQSIDGMGFNKMDTAIGHSLAAAPRLSPRQAALGKRLTIKYRRQLPADLVDQIKQAA